MNIVKGTKVYNHIVLSCGAVKRNDLYAFVLINDATSELLSLDRRTIVGIIEDCDKNDDNFAVNLKFL